MTNRRLGLVLVGIVLVSFVAGCECGNHDPGVIPDAGPAPDGAGEGDAGFVEGDAVARWIARAFDPIREILPT